MKKLRIVHYPQIPCKSFNVEVENLHEAKKIMTLLAVYDYFQLDNNIKPDYCNTNILEQYNEDTKEWENWRDEETGIDDIEEYLEFINEQ